MNEDHINLLMRVPLLHGYTVHGVRSVLESGTVKSHLAGERLFKEGDKPEGVLLVISGRLDVYVNRHDQDLVINQAIQGDVVGELAVLCGLDRSASVRAAEDCKVLHWTAGAFRHLLLSDGLFSERVFRRSLGLLLKKELELIEEQTEAGKSPSS